MTEPTEALEDATEASEAEMTEALDAETTALDSEATRLLEDWTEATETDSTEATEAFETEAETLLTEATETTEACDADAIAALAEEVIHLQASETAVGRTFLMGLELWVALNTLLAGDSRYQSDLFSTHTASQEVQKEAGLASAALTALRSPGTQTAADLGTKYAGVAWTKVVPRTKVETRVW